jgi:hypothetical protein
VKNNKIREYLSQEKIPYEMEYAELPDRSYWLIRDCILFAFQKKYAGIQPGVYQYGITEPMLIQHVRNILKTHFVSDLGVVAKFIFLLVYLFFLIGIPLMIIMPIVLRQLNA